MFYNFQGADIKLYNLPMWAIAVAGKTSKVAAGFKKVGMITSSHNFRL